MSEDQTPAPADEGARTTTPVPVPTPAELICFIDVFDALSRFEGQQRMIRGYGAFGTETPRPDPTVMKVLDWLRQSAALRPAAFAPDARDAEIACETRDVMVQNYEEQIAALKAENAPLREAAETAARLFDHYAEEHRKKDTPHGYSRAARNECAAQELRAALAGPAP